MTFHIVRMNDKIEKIALSYQLDIEEIKECNKYIKDWNHLIPGTKLRLPEISNVLNEELDNYEPFIEEYYPKLSNNYEDLNNITGEDLNDTNIIENDVLENIPKQQTLVLPKSQMYYPYQNYYFNYPYNLYYTTRFNHSKRK